MFYLILTVIVFASTDNCLLDRFCPIVDQKFCMDLDGPLFHCFHTLGLGEILGIVNLTAFACPEISIFEHIYFSISGLDTLIFCSNKHKLCQFFVVISSSSQSQRVYHPPLNPNDLFHFCQPHSHFFTHS